MVIWYYMACWDIMTYNDTQNLDEKIWKVGNLGLTWKKLFVPSWKHVSTFLGGCYNDTWCCFSREKWTVQLAHDGCIFWTGKLILILSCHVRFPSGPGGFFLVSKASPWHEQWVYLAYVVFMCLWVWSLARVPGVEPSWVPTKQRASARPGWPGLVQLQLTDIQHYSTAKHRVKQQSIEKTYLGADLSKLGCTIWLWQTVRHGKPPISNR